ncbi:MAG: 50S ribosomal protein L32 [Thermoguttaceae bacterium]|nr:50S ribosomal protein L32 [Thermoguttaceae bacterium]MDO4856893.1 50S ribosomal protein L32 [Thermoguttaceae bacterium]
MAVPKRKHSNARTGSRRAHDGKTAKQISYCPNCGSAVMSHVVCPNCGQYRNMKVIEVNEK